MQLPRTHRLEFLVPPRARTAPKARLPEPSTSPPRPLDYHRFSVPDYDRFLQLWREASQRLASGQREAFCKAYRAHRQSREIYKDGLDIHQRLETEANQLPEEDAKTLRSIVISLLPPARGNPNGTMHHSTYDALLRVLQVPSEDIKLKVKAPDDITRYVNNPRIIGTALSAPGDRVRYSFWRQTSNNQDSSPLGRREETAIVEPQKKNWADKTQATMFTLVDIADTYHIDDPLLLRLARYMQDEEKPLAESRFWVTLFQYVHKRLVPVFRHYEREIARNMSSGSYSPMEGGRLAYQAVVLTGTLDRLSEKCDNKSLDEHSRRNFLLDIQESQRLVDGLTGTLKIKITAQPSSPYQK